MAREISSSTEYVLDDFDEEFPELYNALYQNALSGRARQARKACELATLGRRLAAQPRFGGLRDPGRLVQRPSHAPEVAELTAALRTARRSARLLRDEILGQTPQAKAAADARARKIHTPDRPTQSKRSAVVGTPSSRCFDCRRWRWRSQHSAEAAELSQQPGPGEAPAETGHTRQQWQWSR